MAHQDYHHHSLRVPHTRLYSLDLYFLVRSEPARERDVCARRGEDYYYGAGSGFLGDELYFDRILFLSSLLACVSYYRASEEAIVGMKLTDLPLDLLQKILEFVPVVFENKFDVLNLQLSCKALEKATAEILYRSLKLDIFPESKISVFQEGLLRFSKYNYVVESLDVTVPFPLQKVFTRPLNLYALKYVHIRSAPQSHTDVSIALESMGCLSNLEELALHGTRLSGLTLVPWHEYTSLKSLIVTSRDHKYPLVFADDVVFPPSIETLTLSRVSMPLSELYAKIEHIENLQLLSLDLGLETFSLPPRRLCDSIITLELRTNSVVPDMSALRSLQDFYWNCRMKKEDWDYEYAEMEEDDISPFFTIHETQFPGVLPNSLRRVYIRADGWIPGAESCTAPHLTLELYKLGTEFNEKFPLGVYLSNVKVLSLREIYFCRDYSAFRYAVSLKVLNMRLYYVMEFLESVGDVRLPQLQKFVILCDEDTFVEEDEEYIDNLYEIIDDRFTNFFRDVRIVESCDSESEDDEEEEIFTH